MTDDGFKLQAEICRTFYTLEELSTPLLFIYKTHTQPDVLSKSLSDTFSDFLPNLSTHSY